MTAKPKSNPALISSKTFPVQYQPKLTTCCPTMDLVALTTVEERVDVYRFGGQKAFGVQRKEPGVKVESVCWKYNGM
jgi:anaphase-promoting complex subunit 4